MALKAYTATLTRSVYTMNSAEDRGYFLGSLRLHSEPHRAIMAVRQASAVLDCSFLLDVLY